MKIINVSKEVTRTRIPNQESGDIYLIYQFFIHANRARFNEISKCLRYNILNPAIHRIILLNERIYTSAEMGIADLPADRVARVVQVNIGERLTFKRAFQHVTTANLCGYIAIINADIFFDHTLENLRYSDLHLQKKMLALLRYEYDGNDKRPPSKGSVIFGPRMDSQDTWILHSNFVPKADNQLKLFQFYFGKPGCDNKLVYLMNILGFETQNDPEFIRTYHYHKTEIRNYTPQEAIPMPWGVIIPAGDLAKKTESSLGIDLPLVTKMTRNFKDLRFDDNKTLYDYIRRKLDAGAAFVLPRIAGVENNCAVRAEMVSERTKAAGRAPTDPLFTQDDLAYFGGSLPVMKNNAGILMNAGNTIFDYSARYMAAFDNCELFSGWEPHGEVYKWIVASHDYMRAKYMDKKMIWGFVFDIFHYVYNTPWTHALRGKRVLVVSAFEDSIKEKIPVRAALYDGVDLFPDCEILTIKPPQTQGNNPSDGFLTEFDRFARRLDALKDAYDVALVSCGGYGNMTCNYIFEKHGKSAIYVGGALQMYFGILGKRWFRERGDVIKLFLNSHWSRPKDVEKPQGFEAVENSCYW